MPGVLLWGYYPTTKKWIPLQVDADGYVKVDMSAINLNDLGDVNAPAPADGDALVWDDATSRWIPAPGAAPGAHHATHEDGGADEINLDDLLGTPDNIMPLHSRTMDEYWKTMDGWTPSVVGSGSDTHELMRLDLDTGATINSRASRYTGNITSHPFRDGLRLIITVRYDTSIANQEARIYLVKNTETMAPLSDTEQHGGFKIIGADIYATNADGTTEKATDTGIDAVAYGSSVFELRGRGTSIEFYVDGVLKATHTDNLPTQWGYAIVLEVKNTIAANRGIRVMLCKLIAA